MAILIVVNNPANWPLKSPGVDIVSAKSYLSDQRMSELRGAKVFNLCRSYRYQSMGYYVSLLAEARGHKPLPSITTIQDLKSLSMMRLASEDLDDTIQETLSRLNTDTFVLSIYFGRNVAKRYDRLALRLFNMFPAPLLRAQFARTADRWQLQSLAPISSSDIPPEHLEFVIQGAEEYFAGKRRLSGRRAVARYDLAILYNPEAASQPSTRPTIDRFIAAARRCGLNAEIIGRDDYGRLAEFDALFIRETTAVNHHTYRFARRAAAEGLVVIDDPESIVRCSNKVFLAEMLERHDIPHPRTFIAHKDNIEDIPLYVGFPCVLKQPDSAFSQGVFKCDDPAALEKDVTAMLAKSDLAIAQEYLPSSFDWRVGVLDRKPLFVARYHMVKGHWQIVGTDREGRRRYGRVEAVPVEAAPRRVVLAAVRAANAIGDGLYGVDVKQIGARPYVIEVNDNPNIDWGYEDKILGSALYDQLMNVFLQRIRLLREPATRPLRRVAPSAQPLAGGSGGGVRSAVTVREGPAHDRA
ncbi:MAG: RimK family protein [Phycisphaeraceae bacterium]|nr:RimK family protein [Phycisphaeraceae bacterium]